MFEDDLANQIGELMSEQEQELDPRLEQLALGTISDEDRAALEREAADNPELAEAVALHQPLSEEVHQRLAETARQAPENVTPIRPRRMQFIGAGVAAALALAAALFVFSSAAVQPIPEYSVMAEAGDAVWRGETETTTSHLREDSEMSIVFTPARMAKGSIEAELWVVTASGQKLSKAKPEISKDGAVRWLDTARSLSGGATGKVSFVAFVGRASAFPEPDSRAMKMSGPGWHSFDVAVEIQPLGATP